MGGASEEPGSRSQTARSPGQRRQEMPRPSTKPGAHRGAGSHPARGSESGSNPALGLPLIGQTSSRVERDRSGESVGQPDPNSAPIRLPLLRKATATSQAGSAARTTPKVGADGRIGGFVAAALRSPPTAPTRRDSPLIQSTLVSKGPGTVGIRPALTAQKVAGRDEPGSPNAPRAASAPDRPLAVSTTLPCPCRYCWWEQRARSLHPPGQRARHGASPDQSIISLLSDDGG